MMATATAPRPLPRVRKGGRRTIGRGWVIATYVGLIIFLLWTLIPFIWMFLASVKTNKEIYEQFSFLPKRWTWEHYQSLFSATTAGRSKASANFSRWLLNSALVSFVVTMLSIVLGALAAYSVTRLRFTGRATL